MIRFFSLCMCENGSSDAEVREAAEFDRVRAPTTKLMRLITAEKERLAIVDGGQRINLRLNANTNDTTLPWRSICQTS